MAARFTAEYSEFMLEGNGIEACLIQEFGSPHIIIDGLVLDLKPHDRRIVIGAAMIRHGHDIGLEIGLRHQERTMQIVCESRDPTATGQIVSDERYFGMRCRLCFHQTSFKREEKASKPAVCQPTSIDDR